MKKSLTYFNLILTMVFWGLTYIWTKQILEFYKPITIILVRLTVSVIFMYLLSLFVGRIQKIDRKDTLQLILLSLFQPFLYFICENYGLMYVSSTITAVIIAMIPLFTPIAAFIFLKEKLSRFFALGLIISFVGVVMVIIKNDFSFSAHPYGIILLLLAVLSAAIYAVIVYRLRDRYNAVSILFWQNFIGAIMFIPLFLVVDLKHVASVGFISETVIPFLFLAVLGSSLAYIFFINGIQELGMTTATMFTNTIPIFTAVSAFFLLGEKLTPLNMIGIIVALSGIMLTQMRFKKNLKSTIN